MQTRENITKSVKRLMRIAGLTNMATMAERLGVAPEYMPQKIRDDRWTMDDIDTLADIFGVTVSTIVSGVAGPVGWRPGQGARKAYEISFVLADGETKTCLEVASSAHEAINSITSVWDPAQEIKQVLTEEKHYFSVNIPASPVEGGPLPLDENGDESD